MRESGVILESANYLIFIPTFFVQDVPLFRKKKKKKKRKKVFKIFFQYTNKFLENVIKWSASRKTDF